MQNLIAFPNDNRISVELFESKVNNIYEYDSIKWEKDLIDRKASIGVADLDNTHTNCRVGLKEYDLSEC